jgi:hypothetical protein
MTVLFDAAGRRRSPATLPGYNAGRAPRNKGVRYPADPPTIDEIVAVMRHAADDRRQGLARDVERGSVRRPADGDLDSTGVVGGHEVAPRLAWPSSR